MGRTRVRQMGPDIPWCLFLVGCLVKLPVDLDLLQTYVTKELIEYSMKTEDSQFYPKLQKVVKEFEYLGLLWNFPELRVV